MNKQIIIDYEEYLVLEHINKIHKNEMNKLRNCVVIPDKEYEQLQQENKELKEELQKADSITQSCIFNGKKESELNFRQSLNLVKELRKENKELHNKIDKAIEYINSQSPDAGVSGKRIKEILKDNE